ncbi:cytidine deaminase homotetrameric [Lucifera butyrica]|uniref:Cytidine deaminase n=1 Tax=Lucifera butyrica TaxID=1351585 RepID=A0A498R9Y7_9FIRM|nr:cytidine deaminase [Lucifera butyrica]VBB07092.1 cytidine deaminase homotetrameric [Lucifera butyrica]
MQDSELLKQAAQASKASYSPYSGYKVGAALLCEDGSIYTGCNVENISYGGTICAERTAVVKAVSEGKTRFVKIAVSVSGKEYGIPCGLCLQFLSEFVAADFEVICGNCEGDFVKYSFDKIMPAVFKSASVKHI